MTDVDLWNSFRRGDRSAFRQIYDVYAKDLINYGYKMTDDGTLIEDTVHDLFVELWHARKLSDTTSIRFYLFGALRNKLSAVLRRNSDTARVDVEMLRDHFPDHSFEQSLIDKEEQQQLLDQLHKGYQQLTDRQQQALNLRFYMHFSNEEIAQIMGVNYQSACKFIYTGLKALRETVRILSITGGILLATNILF